VHAAIDAAAKAPAANASPDARLRWRSLAAALAEREGLLGVAFDELVLLSGEDALPIELRTQAELALVRMLEAGRDPARGVAALEASLAREPAALPEARAFAWLRLADLRMSAGAVPEARAAYERAAAKLPSGALRDRALHHAAFVSRAGAERSEALGIAVAAGSQSAWSELSALEIQLRQLSEELDDSAMNGQ
jgi:tetratricopeptide (TPR) repeat protein